MVSGEGQARNVPLLVRTIFTVQTASSTHLVDNAFNKLSKDFLRIIQEGVKVEFIDKQSFHPPRKAPKFVQDSDVEFVIQALLQGRQTGAYGDLAPGGHEYLSRSRVQTPQNEKQRLVHALIPLNDATVKKRRARCEDLRQLSSTLKSNDFLISLDVESAFFHVITPNLLHLPTKSFGCLWF